MLITDGKALNTSLFGDIRWLSTYTTQLKFLLIIKILDITIGAASMDCRVIESHPCLCIWSTIHQVK